MCAKQMLNSNEETFMKIEGKSLEKSKSVSRCYLNVALFMSTGIGSNTRFATIARLNNRKI